jgi:hypothetical protein
VFAGHQRKLECSPRPAWVDYKLIVDIAIAATLGTKAIFAGAASLTALFIATTALVVWVLDHPGPRSPSDQQPRDEQGNSRP